MREREKKRFRGSKRNPNRSSYTAVLVHHNRRKSTVVLPAHTDIISHNNLSLSALLSHCQIDYCVSENSINRIDHPFNLIPRICKSTHHFLNTLRNPATSTNYQVHRKHTHTQLELKDESEHRYVATSNTQMRALCAFCFCCCCF